MHYVITAAAVPLPSVVRDPIESAPPPMEGSWPALHSHPAYQHSTLHNRAVLVHSQRYTADTSSLAIIVNTHTNVHTNIHTRLSAFFLLNLGEMLGSLTVAR